MHPLTATLLVAFMVAVAVVTLAPHAYAQPAPNLKGVALTADEIGPGWSKVSELDAGETAYTALYMRGTRSPEAVGITLLDDAEGRLTTAELVQDVERGFRTGVAAVAD